MKPSKSKNSKKKAHSTDRLQEWYDTLDFRTWWEEFATKCNENGTLKYRTVWAFITAKTKIQWQRDLLWWVLGPLGNSETYKAFEQFDFDKRRENGYWYSSTNADKLSKEVKAHANALDSLREVGKVNISFISRIENLAKEIDREYSGRLYLPQLSMKENNLRAKAYTGLLEDLFSMMEKAQIMYGRTQGLDLERLDQFLAMFGKGMGQQAAQMGFVSGKVIEGETGETSSSIAMKQITEMMIAKAAQHEIDLPDEDIANIVAKSQKPRLGLVAQKG